MDQIEFPTAEREVLRYWRFYHPHPRVQLKMDAAPCGFAPFLGLVWGWERLCVNDVYGGTSNTIAGRRSGPAIGTGAVASADALTHGHRRPTPGREAHPLPEGAFGEPTRLRLGARRRV